MKSSEESAIAAVALFTALFVLFAFVSPLVAWWRRRLDGQ